MSRRNRAAKREVLPDPMYNSTVITKLVNQIMLDGKKGIAFGIVYGALDIIKEKMNEEPMTIFTQALENLKPVLSKAKDGISCFFKEGISVTQNKYN